MSMPKWLRIMSAVLLLVLTAASQAEPLPEQKKSGGLVVVPGNLTEVRAMQLLNRSNPPLDTYLDDTITVLPYDKPELILRVQQALLRSKTARGCEAEKGTLTGYLDLATRALGFLDHAQAQRELQSAYRAIQCTHAQISAQEFARYLFLFGLKESLEGYTPELYFMQALGMDSKLPAPVRYSKAIRAAFERARVQLSQEAKIQVEIEADANGILTRVDGDIPLRGIVHLQPGLHVVQRETETGEVLISDVIRLQRPDVGTVMWPPDQMRVDSASIVTQTLEQWASQASPSDTDEALLRALVERSDVEWILFLNSTSGIGNPLGVLATGSTLMGLTLGPPPLSIRQERQQRRAIISGAITLVSTGLYLGGIYLSMGAGDISYVFQGAGGLGMGIGGFGVGFSLWQLMFPEPVTKKDRASPTTEPP